MRTRRRVTSLLLMTLLLTVGAALVRGQGGTGKLPPPGPAMPPPMRRMPPPRKLPPPDQRQVITDIYVAPRTSSGSLSMTERLPEELGQFRRNKLETNVSDYTNEDYGAVEVLRAEYGKDILIFLSRFRDAASANSTMQAFAKKAAGAYYIVSRKHIKNRSGQALGEFWLSKISGREKNVYLLVTYRAYLYRVYGYSVEDVQRVFSSLPLE